VDIARAEATEKELDALVRRRHDRRVESEGERAAEEMWAESERRHAARRREVNRAAWRTFHEDQAARHRAVLEGLIGYHNAEAQKYRPEKNGHQPRGGCESE
jgi:hypothetical protein